ncbi:MAG: glycan-binding surface protein, partial [Prevotellaceae bacterium]|nr:glycan-binding surface protein [Prevotellaceae bacterium]
MKNLIIKNIWVLVAVIAFFGCKDENAINEGLPFQIDRIFLENAQSSVPDRPVEFARQGQTVRLSGSGFVGLQKVLINGEEVYFNPVYISANSMIVSVPSNLPTIEAADDVRNTICLIKGNQKYCYNFEIRSAAPSITNVSHTMAQAGEEITLTGTGLHEVRSVIFPGDIQATVFSSDNEKGKWCKVIVPEGITESGVITFTGANGGVYSAPYFNYKEGVLHNFDDVSNYSWGSGIDNVALTDAVPAAAGNLPKSQGGYQIFNANGNAVANSDQRFWLNSNVLMTLMGLLPASTSVNDCGIQFDVYVEDAWNSGIIRFVIADGWGASKYCVIYQPAYPNGTSYDITAFENPGCWFTVTL